MEMKTSSGGLYISIDPTQFEIPENLKTFLGIEDQGMDGLEFMLDNEKLAKRIPEEILEEYQALYERLLDEISVHIELFKKKIEELENNPRPQIHAMINELFKKSMYE